MTMRVLTAAISLCLFCNVIASTSTSSAASPTTTTTSNTSLPTTAPQQQSTDSESCAQICAKTYALHTYPQSEHLSACNRGCRFFTLIDLVSDDSSENGTRNECLRACGDAYNETEYYACSIGCNNKASIGKRRENEDEGINNQLLASPFQMMQSLFHAMMNSGAQLVQRSSMSVYITRNGDGESKVVVVQSEPEVVVHRYPDLLRAEYDNGESVTATEERTTPDNKPRVDLSLWTNENPLLVHHPNRQKENGWGLNCFGYQSGAPRWLLACVLFLAIFVLAWICCATTATAPEQHIRRRVGMGSDLKYLCLYDEPVKMVINGIDDKPPSYHEIQCEAAPLPLKVNLESEHQDSALLKP